MGLRIDVAAENEATGETRWIDVTVSHTGADSYQDKEIKAVRKKQLSGHLSSSLSIPDPLTHEPSPTLVDHTARKNEKYSRLLLVAKKQARKRSASRPLSLALSQCLTMASLLLQHWNSRSGWCQYQSKVESVPKRSAGCKPVDLVRDFRFRLQLVVQLAVASGFGERKAWR